jgi:hypothetical protein
MTPSTRKSSQASGGIRHAARRQPDGHREAGEVGGTIGRKSENRGITTAAGIGEVIEWRAKWQRCCGTRRRCSDARARRVDGEHPLLDQVTPQAGSRAGPPLLRLALMRPQPPGRGTPRHGRA